MIIDVDLWERLFNSSESSAASLGSLYVSVHLHPATDKKRVYPALNAIAVGKKVVRPAEYIVKDAGPQVNESNDSRWLKCGRPDSKRFESVDTVTAENAKPHSLPP